MEDHIDTAVGAHLVGISVEDENGGKKVYDTPP